MTRPCCYLHPNLAALTDQVGLHFGLQIQPHWPLLQLQTRKPFHFLSLLLQLRIQLQVLPRQTQNYLHILIIRSVLQVLLDPPVQPGHAVHVGTACVFMCQACLNILIKATTTPPL